MKVGEIETGVTISNVRKKGRWQNRFDVMNYGDSFVITTDEKDPTLHRIQLNILQAVRDNKERDYDITTRITPEGLRVWKIERKT